MLEKYKRFNPDNNFGVDHAFIEKYGRRIQHLLCAYFRPELHNAERIPLDTPAIIYSNHSGIGFWDVMSIVHSANEYFKDAGRPERLLRMVSHPNWFNWPVMDQYYAKLGYFPASIENARYLLEHDEVVWWLPEGNIGAWKTCDRKYQMTPFSSGFVVAALASRSPLLPAAVIGAEDAHNIIWNSYRFAKDGLPLFITNPVPWPFKIHVHIGEPFKIPEQYRKERLEKRELKEVAELAQKHLQAYIYECLELRELMFPRASRAIEKVYQKMIIRKRTSS